MERPHHTGRTTEPPMITVQDILKRAKEASEKAAEVLKNPAVPAGTRRTDIVIGICHECGRRKVIGSRSRTCDRCFWKTVDPVLTENDEKMTALKESMAE